jgi:Multiubiquitin
MADLQQSADNILRHGVQPSAHLVNIIVEVNGKNKHVQFDKPIVTGREIRDAAGASPSDDLTRLVHGKPSGGNIGPDDSVEIKNGDHFIALPTGTVS